MRPIRALLNTANDGLRLGRCLETLHACDGIVVFDHGSTDDTVCVARQYGAKVITAAHRITGEAYRHHVHSIVSDGWLLCLDPHESLTESLAASLYEWTLLADSAVLSATYSLAIREETHGGWVDHPHAETRLVPAAWEFWTGHFPSGCIASVPLEGKLLRFVFP